MMTEYVGMVLYKLIYHCSENRYVRQRYLFLVAKLKVVVKQISESLLWQPQLRKIRNF